MIFSVSLFAELEKLAYDYEHEAGTREDYHRHNRNTKAPRWRTALPVGAGIGSGIGALASAKGKRLRGAGIGALLGLAGGAAYKGLRHLSIADSKDVMSLPRRKRLALLKARARHRELNSKELVEAARHEQLLRALERR